MKKYFNLNLLGFLISSIVTEEILRYVFSLDKIEAIDIFALCFAMVTFSGAIILLIDYIKQIKNS